MGVSLLTTVCTLAVHASPVAAATPITPVTYLSNPELQFPAAVAFDAKGDLYIASVLDDAVTVVPAASGVLFGKAVTADDPVTLISSGLDDPLGLAFDSAGNLFISNAVNNTVSVLPVASGTVFGQSVTADTLSTVVSTGQDTTPFGIAFDRAGNLYIESNSADTVSVLPASSGTLFGRAVTTDTLTTLISTGLDEPTGIAVDSAGNLYISNGNPDSPSVSVFPVASGTLFGHVVKADNASTLISSGISEPWGLTFDSAGNLYVADAGANTVLVLPTASGKIFGVSVTAHNLATIVSVDLDGPTGVTIEGGNLFVANSNPGTLAVLPAASGTLFFHAVTADTVQILFGPGLQGPSSLVFDRAGNLYVLNANDTVAVLPAASGTLFGQSVTAGSLTELIATEMDDPTSLVLDAAGNIYITNSANNSVSVLPVASGTLFGQAVKANTLTTLISSGLNSPSSAAFDRSGNLFISNAESDIISVLPVASGTLFGQAVKANTLTTLVKSSSGLHDPRNLTFDSAGNLYILNGTSNSLAVLPVASGTLFGQTVTADALTTLISSGLSESGGMAFDATGNLFILGATGDDAQDGTVSVISPDSGYVFGQPVTADTLTTLISSGLYTPAGLVFDTTGNLYISNLNVVSYVELIDTVVFHNDNPDSNSISALSGHIGDSIALPAAPSYPGNLFDGWYSAAAGGTLVGQPGASYVVKASTDLYAHWTPIAITSISPTSGPAFGGTTVTLTGTGFAGVTGVTVGGVAVTSFKIVSPTEITAVTPPQSGGLHGFAVTTPDGPSTYVGADVFTALAPTITSISPTSGLAMGGTTVKIVGSEFTGVDNVTVGGKAVTSYTVDSSSEITAVTPALSIGQHGFAVTTSDGTSPYVSADLFTVVGSAAAPTITAISPTAGPTLGGTTVTITGTGFSGANKVTFGGVTATNPIVVSSTEMTAVSPTLGLGQHAIAVTTPNGTSANVGADVFTVVAPPTITAISPTAGPTLGGTTVTITGTGFTGATRVTFGGVTATSPTVISSTEMTAVSPALGIGLHGIAVTTPGGTSTYVSADVFTAAAPPTITSISPTEGGDIGGTKVTITGTGFTGATKVTFGGVTAPSYTVVSSTEMTAISPALGTGQHGIAVTTPGGTSVYVSADVFTAQSGSS
jgi:IPT/TIG domain/Listeria-Bacteroides repeat domain (List_Bact_rpt)